MTDLQPLIGSLSTAASAILSVIAAYFVWKIKFSEKSSERKTDQVFFMAEQYIKNCGETQTKYEELLQQRGAWATERADWLLDKEEKERRILELEHKIQELQEIVDSMTKEKYGYHSVSTPDKTNHPM